MSESRYRTGVRLAQLEFQTATMRRHLRLAVWLNVGGPQIGRLDVSLTSRFWLDHLP